MRTLVIFESMFGNTQRIAEAIAAGIGEQMDVELLPVDQAPTRFADDVGLVVVGGPTHAFGISRAQTRRSAADQADTTVTPATAGIREWLASLEPGTTPVATFDTRIKKRWLPGSAARGIRTRVRRLGYRPAGTTSFWVTGTSGPLADGEETRARDWAKHLVSVVPTR